MNAVIIIIISVIIIFIVANTICFFCFKHKQISGFDANQIAGYADVSDPYDMPFTLQQLLTPEHCRQIISASVDKLVDSQVIGGNHRNIRNSRQHWIGKNDPLVKPLFEEIARSFGIPFENAEDLQVVRYQPNQYYNEHHDSCCENNDKCIAFANRGGQRILTVLIYLNNEFDEGNTYFKNLNLKVKPATGDAIVFYPLAKNSNKCHPYALHAGMPVTGGEKWIANLWFRENKFIA